MNDDSINGNYRGKRALVLLRVSSPEQEKGFGWPSQERQIRRKVIEPLGLLLDEQKHIIRDTYTGLEFRERPALERILEMARRREFDVLVTDVLDRLGRRGLARELYRMQLKELGVRILTTDPQEHADDDSLVGEMIRILKGYQAEEELNNTRRRSMNAKRVIIEGDKDKGIAPMIVGGGHRYYGYEYVENEHGKKVGVRLRPEVILVDAEGIEWSEVDVVKFIFDQASQGTPLRQIAHALNDKDIPPPYVAKGLSTKLQKYTPAWQASTVSRLVRQSAYWGEARFYKRPVLERVPGKRDPARKKTLPEEQLVVSVPAIVTREIAEAAQEHAKRNRRLSNRNNPNPKDYLLRAGLARCGYCGGSMSAQHHKHANKDGSVTHYTLYNCITQQGILKGCKGCSILAPTIDEAAWEYTVAIMQDPSLVDRRVQEYRSDDPTADRRRNINAKLKQIRDEQQALQEYLTDRIKKRMLDRKTEDHLTTQLHQLAEQEQKWLQEKAQDEDVHERWLTLQEKVDAIHQKCAVMREKLSDPGYSPSYDEKRELLEFFGITVSVWRPNSNPRFEVRSNPPSIVLHLSVWGPRRRPRPTQAR